MGGADRTDKKRRQDEASRRLAAAGIRVPEKKSNNTTVIVVVVVVVLALLIGGGLLYLRNRASGTPTAGTYTATVSGAVVTAGTGKASIDVYEDFLCPNCERFEQRDGAAITTALNEGKLTVRYHSIAILDGNTTPAGYSTRAANASVCAAAAGIFPAYHAALFAQQPAEGSAGLTDQQLTALVPNAPADFAACVTSGRNAAAVTAETNKAVADTALQTDGQFGTPTVAANGTKINLNDSGWLKAVTG